jgi:hypothetical protein
MKGVFPFYWVIFGAFASELPKSARKGPKNLEHIYTASEYTVLVSDIRNAEFYAEFIRIKKNYKKSNTKRVQVKNKLGWT